MVLLHEGRLVRTLRRAISLVEHSPRLNLSTRIFITARPRRLLRCSASPSRGSFWVYSPGSSGRASPTNNRVDHAGRRSHNIGPVATAGEFARCRMVLPVLHLGPGVTPELANCRRGLRVVRSQPAAGGQTELPNGCGRLALRAYEEKPWRAGGHCRCPRRMAGDLLSNGRGHFDDHDCDYALQGLAAVSPFAAGERFPLT